MAVGTVEKSRTKGIERVERKPASKKESPKERLGTVINEFLDEIQTSNPDLGCIKRESAFLSHWVLQCGILAKMDKTAEADVAEGLRETIEFMGKGVSDREMIKACQKAFEERREDLEGILQHISAVRNEEIIHIIINDVSSLEEVNTVVDNLVKKVESSCSSPEEKIEALFRSSTLASTSGKEIAELKKELDEMVVSRNTEIINDEILLKAFTKAIGRKIEELKESSGKKVEPGRLLKMPKGEKEVVGKRIPREEIMGRIHVLRGIAEQHEGSKKAVSAREEIESLEKQLRETGREGSE